MLVTMSLVSARRMPAPVEYAAAVERYLGQASLGPASRRVYRISLAAWAWPLVGQRVPLGERRRGAVPPVVPLALLDDPSAAAKLAGAIADRAADAGARTVNRELSALRSAVGWFLDQRWISADPTAGLHHLATAGVVLPPLTPGQVASLFRATTSLREHAFWRMLYDTAAPTGEVLGLDIGRLDLARHRARSGPAPGPATWLDWREGTTQLLRWLLAGADRGTRLPHRPPRSHGIRSRAHLPPHRPGQDVLPPGRGDLHRGHPPAGPGRPGLDAAPALPGRAGRRDQKAGQTGNAGTRLNQPKKTSASA